MLDVYLWHTRTDLPAARRAALEPLLSAAEHERARSFRFDRDRGRFVAARAFLRTVLGRHLDEPPDRVRLEATRGEKPRLIGPGGDGSLGFNLSRSGDLAVCGVVRGRQIGVDVEHVRDLPDLDALARTILAPHELSRWAAAEPGTRLRRFFSIWTRKEALGKAEGRGIADGPRSIAVPLDPLPAGVRASVEGSRPPTGWILSDYVPAAGIAGCVVVEQRHDDALAESWQDIDPEDAGDVAPHGPLPAGVGLVIRRFASP